MFLLGLLLGILEVLLWSPLTMLFWGFPLVATAVVWLGGSVLGGYLGYVLSGPEGVLLGSVVGAGVFSGIYSGLVSRYFSEWFLGAGAGWRYWRLLHKRGLPELPHDYEHSEGYSPLALEIGLDMAAACLFAATCALARGWLGGALAGLLTFGLWGSVWGLYLGATVPREANYYMDFNGLAAANVFSRLLCPSPMPFARYSVRWALGCGIGYAIQALPLGIVPGMIGAIILVRWR
jgi:hypothetical protein